MAIGGDSATQLASLLTSLFTDKKTINSVTPKVNNNFDQLMASLIPQAQNNLTSQGNMDALLQSVMGQASRSFAPNKALQNQAGMYNSSSLDFMRNDAMAKATEQAIQVMMDANLKGQANQLNAAQLAGGMNSQMGQLTATQNMPAALGGLSMPAAAYALYKYMQPDGTKQAVDMMGATKKVGEVANSANAASQGLNGAAQASSVMNSNANMAGQLDSILSSSIAGGAAPAASSFAKAAGTGEALSSLDGFSNISEGFTGVADFSAGLDDLLTSSAGIQQLGGTADSVANITGGAGSGLDILGSLTNGLSEFVGGIPIVGEGLVNLGSEIGSAASGISDFFTPSVNIPGFGATGIPLLAGLGNFMEGDYLQGVGDIGATAALSMIPVVGAPLALLSGFTKNGILDDWFGIEDCYITTAVTKATGGPDDAYELETLRKYRDEFMKATPAGKELIQNYYDVAPKVVAKLSARKDNQEIYNYFYHRYIVPAVKQIEAGNNYAALTIYREMSEFAETIANSKEGN